MTIETTLTTLLKVQCANTFPDFAPAGTSAPLVTYDLLGGESLRYVDTTASNKRHGVYRINAWASTRGASLTLIRAIEDAICASTDWQARPTGESESLFDAEMKLYGSSQDFDIWGTR